jgi:hypothetical protein
MRFFQDTAILLSTTTALLSVANTEVAAFMNFAQIQKTDGNSAFSWLTSFATEPSKDIGSTQSSSEAPGIGRVGNNSPDSEMPELLSDLEDVAKDQIEREDAAAAAQQPFFATPSKSTSSSSTSSSTTTKSDINVNIGGAAVRAADGAEPPRLTYEIPESLVPPPETLLAKEAEAENLVEPTAQLSVEKSVEAAAELNVLSKELDAEKSVDVAASQLKNLSDALDTELVGEIADKPEFEPFPLLGKKRLPSPETLQAMEKAAELSVEGEVEMAAEMKVERNVVADFMKKGIEIASELMTDGQAAAASASASSTATTDAAATTTLPQTSLSSSTLKFGVKTTTTTKTFTVKSIEPMFSQWFTPYSPTKKRF